MNINIHDKLINKIKKTLKGCNTQPPENEKEWNDFFIAIIETHMHFIESYEELK